MHTIEPFMAWQKYYDSSKDLSGPFYGRSYNLFECTNTVYNYFIHPLWDEFGSSTLYLKILYANYDQRSAIIEFLGEWNDTLYNDIMFLKRNVIEILLNSGINKYILIGENVMNFHASDDLYYEEWVQELEGGWIAAINFQQHVINEFAEIGIDQYIEFSHPENIINWRTIKPAFLVDKIDQLIHRQLP